jgi:DhnA family fructose-bisphosphate aldolase class Ia
MIDMIYCIFVFKNVCDILFAYKFIGFRGNLFSMYGIKRRLGRIFRHDGKVFIAALDHGVSLGFVKGLEDPLHVIDVLSNYVDALIINKGVIRALGDDVPGRVGIIYKLNGITKYSENPYDLRLLGNVEEALSYDADAVSFEMYIGGPQEGRQLEEVSRIISDASKWDLPVIIHAYPHGEKQDPEMISHCIRLGWELGANVVKTFYYQGVSSIIKYVKVPVIAAGGPRMGAPEHVINYVRSALNEGMSGVALGRNLWGWDEETVKEIAKTIRSIIHTHET